MAAKNQSKRIDDLCFVLQHFIGFTATFMQSVAGGEIPPEAQAEIDQMSSLLYNCVSDEGKALVMAIANPTQQGN